MNPYGFNIFQDIGRMCLEPTEKTVNGSLIAGNPDWLGTMKEAMENFKDESFLLQYLSPKVIRDMRLSHLKMITRICMKLTRSTTRVIAACEALASNKRLGDLCRVWRLTVLRENRPQPAYQTQDD